jgi:hypothetical protein
LQRAPEGIVVEAVPSFKDQESDAARGTTLVVGEGRYLVDLQIPKSLQGNLLSRQLQGIRRELARHGDGYTGPLMTFSGLGPAGYEALLDRWGWVEMPADIVAKLTADERRIAQISARLSRSTPSGIRNAPLSVEGQMYQAACDLARRSKIAVTVNGMARQSG